VYRGNVTERADDNIIFIHRTWEVYTK
jgi:hypothetical protein